MNESLESMNQEGSILKVDYTPDDKDGGTCVVKMTVHIDEEGNPMFQGY